MIPKAEIENVSIEWRTVFFADQDKHFGIALCDRVSTAAWLEVHPVEDAVVLICDQIIQDVLPFGS